ncbi:uncharacterized protein PADG_07542 [Paracoccidioides brasiliensis Pb18]|uniref:Dipeptidase n=1 Tax=Paracoccidioides brasiliensis (strain Pb18) TaxID=502780 RepID=C1GJV6_PARBD|nr:uncharacterized protein PADG_07542 [Paracoccidioides brasiliensis Pb18]EEH42722.2 hypothetical protein PADG_07542 [Paracoccidioides brasiliensis Pb18]
MHELKTPPENNILIKVQRLMGMPSPKTRSSGAVVATGVFSMAHAIRIITSVAEHIFVVCFPHKFSGEKKIFSDEIALGQVDFPRLRKGGLRGQFYECNYVGCPQSLRQFLRLSPPRSRLRTLSSRYQQIDLIHRIAKQYLQHLKLSADEVWSNFSISSLIGVEAVIIDMPTAQPPKYPVNNDPSPVDQAIVRVKMNRLGMIVDLAHVSNDPMRDALRISSAPVILSHSSLKRNGGTITITSFPEYTQSDGQGNASLSDMTDHVQHVGNLIGMDIGLGAVFDGMPNSEEGLEDISK